MDKKGKMTQNEITAFIKEVRTRVNDSTTKEPFLERVQNTKHKVYRIYDKETKSLICDNLVEADAKLFVSASNDLTKLCDLLEEAVKEDTRFSIFGR